MRLHYSLALLLAKQVLLVNYFCYCSEYTTAFPTTQHTEKKPLPKDCNSLHTWCLFLFFYYPFSAKHIVVVRTVLEI